VLRLAPANIGAPPAKSLTEHFTRFAELIEEKTEGRVVVEVYWAQTLAPYDQIVNAVSTGLADIGLVIANLEEGKLPLDLVSYIPGFGIDYWAQCMAFWDLMNQEPLLSQYHKLNMRPFSMIFVTDYYLIANKPLNTVADLQGKIIGGGGFIGDTLVKLGATPVSMDPFEQYEGLQKGTIDGNTAPWGAIHDFKWYEVAKHITLWPFGGRVMGVLINEDSWNKISPEDQETIVSLQPDFIQFNVEAFFTDEPYFPLTKEVLDEAGVTIVDPSDEEKEALYAIQATQADEWAAKKEAEGLPGYQVLEDYRELIAKYEKISTFPYK
jgi:TRAP-type C4-dicarboxylate transport system substrate-binding protein